MFRSSMTAESRTILLIEDDKNDVFFLRYALESAGVTNPLQVAEDGEEAVHYLAGAGPYADRERYPIPCLVLLDLKLPFRTGLEVLDWIHRQPELQTLLVVVLTSSAEIADVDAAYRLGARSFLVKPLSVDKRLQLARLIKSYWLEFNESPSLGGCATPFEERQRR